MTNDRIVPTQPSNRSVIHQLKLWGWSIRVTTGDWIDMHHPERPERLRVRPEHYHSGNGKDVLAAVYRANGSADAFWRRDTPYFQSDVRFQKSAGGAQMTDEQMEEFAAAQRAAHEAPASDVETPAVVDPVGSVPAAAEVPQKEGRDVYGVAPRRGTMESNVLNVFESLAPRDVTIGQVSGLLDMSRMEVSNCVSRLVRRGLVLRDPSGRKGIWRRSGLQAQDSIAPAAAAPVLVPVVVTQTAPALKLVPTPTPAVTADVVDDLLDLMFPDGIRARHLDLVEEWRTLTRRLINEVTHAN